MGFFGSGSQTRDLWRTTDAPKLGTREPATRTGLALARVGSSAGTGRTALFVLRWDRPLFLESFARDCAKVYDIAAALMACHSTPGGFSVCFTNVHHKMNMICTHSQNLRWKFIVQHPLEEKFCVAFFASL